MGEYIIDHILFEMKCQAKTSVINICIKIKKYNYKNSIAKFWILLKQINIRLLTLGGILYGYELTLLIIRSHLKTWVDTIGKEKASFLN